MGKMEKTLETGQGRFLVRPYAQPDEEGVLALWKAAFGKEMPPRLWRWKYVDNPHKVQAAVCLSEKGDILVLYGGMPYRANWQGKTVQITHLMDIMSHPVCRGTGLFVKAAEAFFEFFAGPERTPFYYGFPGRQHFVIGEKYLAYRGLPEGVCYLGARTAEVAKKRRFLGGRIELILGMDSSFDGLWTTSLGDYPFTVIRDETFLRWRFFEHPFNDYEFWGYHSSLQRQLKAYAVLLLREGKARLVDMLAPFSEGLIHDFLGRLGADLAGRGVDRLETWLPMGHFLTKAVLSLGFLSSQEPLGIIPTARVFHPSLSFDWAAKNIFYTMADGDLL